ncbi:hypothetical protein H8S75_31520 [Hungatella sp. L12]|uniref:Phage protein n=1 Tax=Hungatella hominis TaxID=2763050 RepID=A0ABR7HGW3_9FIRM|nr:hypothetical protein [Hungatella hominis]MBC5712432.1 hypothetical protein [Hungatella hominis]DAO43341.1 MAG TPA: tail component [Caudoviricetes sp.]
MKDMLNTIYGAMMGNEVIIGNCADRIKYYLYPETGDTGLPFITIRPMQPPQDAVYGSDKALACEFLYQIDVQSQDRKKCKEIQQAVKSVMQDLGFSQQPGGLDEYFEETKRYVDARRYLATTKPYDTDY